VLGQHTKVRTLTLSDIAPLFNTSRDARFLGANGSKGESGQSGVIGANPSQASPLCGEVIDDPYPFSSSAGTLCTIRSRKCFWEVGIGIDVLNVIQVF
jgi:hypothetical protein